MFVIYQLQHILISDLLRGRLLYKLFGDLGKIETEKIMLYISMKIMSFPLSDSEKETNESNVLWFQLIFEKKKDYQVSKCYSVQHIVSALKASTEYILKNI